MAGVSTLNYASPGPRVRSGGQRRLIALACCLTGSWLSWLLLYKASTFPTGFEDEVFHWGEAVVIMAVHGTLCGLLLYLIVLIGMYARYLFTRKRRGSAS